MLKGKALKDFDEFLLKFYDSIYTKPHILQLFNAKLPQEQQGVYLEFFRERDIEITNDIKTDGRVKYWFFIQYSKVPKGMIDPVLTQELVADNDYNTAFTQAIEKACELYWRGE